MAKLNTSQQKRAAKLKFRQLVHGIAREQDVDPDSVEPTLLLANESYDSLDNCVRNLESCLAADLALEAKAYGKTIAELTQLRDESREIRKQLEHEQKAFNERFAALRQMEERANHLHTLQSAWDRERSELLDKRRKLLETTNLDEYPPLV